MLFSQFHFQPLDDVHQHAPINTAENGRKVYSTLINVAHDAPFIPSSDMSKIYILSSKSQAQHLFHKVDWHMLVYRQTFFDVDHTGTPWYLDEYEVSRVHYDQAPVPQTQKRTASDLVPQKKRLMS